MNASIPSWLAIVGLLIATSTAEAQTDAARPRFGEEAAAWATWHAARKPG